MSINKNICPFCGHSLTEVELKELKCECCKHYLINENGEIKVAKNKKFSLTQNSMYVTMVPK